MAGEQDFQIDLARAAAFGLGKLRIHPPTLEVACGTRRETLEPRIMQVFVALARRRGDVVSRDDLITQCWDGRSVGDDAINRCIARLRRLAESEGGFVIETVPRVGYRLKETGTTDTAEPAVAPPRKPKWVPLALAAAVLITAVTAAAFHFRPMAPLNRVAVLPLQPLGGGDEVRVFGAAVAEQIVGVLSENQIQAVSRDQIPNLRGPDRDAAARKLGADFILDGTVQKMPDGLHATIHLDRASSHTTLWTGTFDQNGIDSANLQTAVAARVVDLIKGAQQASGLSDDAAVAAFLKAKEYSRDSSRRAVASRRDQMRIVVAHAPDFSLGHSGLGWSTALLVRFAEDFDVAALRSEAQREARRALELDPHNGEAYLIEVALAPPTDYGEQERLYRQGLAVQPDEPTLNSSLASLLEDVGRIADAVPLHERAVILDPLSPRKTAGLAAIQAVTGNLVQARVTLDHAAKDWPTNPHIWMTRLYLESYGSPEKARALLQQSHRIAIALEPDYLAALEAYVMALSRNTPDTRAAARRTAEEAYAKGHFNDIAMVEMFARLGEVDAAFAMIEPAFFSNKPVDRYTRPDTALLLRPATAPLRRDPRFAALAERLGLMRYWRTHTAPDFCISERVAVCQELQRGAAARRP